MSNDSTRNDRILSLVERAKQGHLLTCATLDSFYIAVLRYPSSEKNRLQWNRQLIRAIEEKKLPHPHHSETYRFPSNSNSSFIVTGYHISKRAYREYLILQQLFGYPIPADSLEYRCWLGATPAVETLPPAEPIPPALPTLPAEPSRTEQTAKPDKRHRNDALAHAIRAAIAVLSPNGGALPRPPELFNYLAHNDTTKTVIGVAKGNRALLWIDDNNNEQPLTVSALGKRLTRIRQGG